MHEHGAFSNSDYEEQTHLAERELNAYSKAVAELFGTEQARAATEDWLEESELSTIRRDQLPGTGGRLPSPARLASRIDTLQYRRKSVAA
jgi:hypothetical protein